MSLKALTLLICSSTVLVTLTCAEGHAALEHLEKELDCVLDYHLKAGGEKKNSDQFHTLEKRSDSAVSQTVFQYQKKAKKCKNLRSYSIASGGNALSYMTFVASIITLVLNINNNINANNNNNNQVNLNLGNNNNVVTNLNQNVGNNFNLMFPPGRRRRRREAKELWRFHKKVSTTLHSCSV